MEILAIISDSSTLQDNYKAKVNKNSFLLFDSKRNYNKITEVKKMHYKLVNEVIKGKESEKYFNNSLSYY